MHMNQKLSGVPKVREFLCTPAGRQGQVQLCTAERAAAQCRVLPQPRDLQLLGKCPLPWVHPWSVGVTFGVPRAVGRMTSESGKHLETKVPHTLTMTNIFMIQSLRRSTGKETEGPGLTPVSPQYTPLTWSERVSIPCNPKTQADGTRQKSICPARILPDSAQKPLPVTQLGTRPTSRRPGLRAARRLARVRKPLSEAKKAQPEADQLVALWSCPCAQEGKSGATRDGQFCTRDAVQPTQSFQQTTPHPGVTSHPEPLQDSETQVLSWGLVCLGPCWKQGQMPIGQAPYGGSTKHHGNQEEDWGRGCTKRPEQWQLCFLCVLRGPSETADSPLCPHRAFLPPRVPGWPSALLRMCDPLPGPRPSRTHQAAASCPSVSAPESTWS